MNKLFRTNHKSTKPNYDAHDRNTEKDVWMSAYK